MFSWGKLSGSSFIASISSLFFRGISVISSFFVGWVVSRLLGVEFAGQALFFLTCITVAVVVSTLGYDSAISKLSAELKGGSLSKLKDVLLVCCKRMIFPTFCCSILFFIYQVSITNTWSSNSWFHTIFTFISTFICILALTFLNIFSYVFQGLGRISLTIFSQRTVFNILLACLLLLALWFFKFMTVEWLLRYTYIAILISALISLFLISYVIFDKILKDERLSLTNEEKSEFYDFGKHAYRISLAQLVSIYSIQFIISILSNMESMSGYLISGRVSSVLAFFILAVSNVLMPSIARSFHNGNYAELKGNYKKSVLFSACMGIPVFLVMFVFAKEILSLFGDGFDRFHVVLRVLLVGQAINCLTGASDMVLTYMGGVKSHKRNVYIGVIISILVSVILIPLYGAIGAAIASLISSSLVNALDVYCIQRRLRFGSV
ncbi:polysaccharide biosynthesis C-terminal domain-containing protein [Aeromonas bivalvium]|uniref:MATE family efflux transporter n=1 Tax=Aeromonas bivalvium TaxID=440079 RepID=UPI000DD0AE13|nr:polysaccharide biosynthesis C-terminal domain-containing protein [Aeromonas bivalvium]